MTAPRVACLAVALAVRALTAAAAFGCGSRAPVIEEPDMNDTYVLPQPPDSCITNYDCDVVDACCRCDQGGKQFAIRKDAIADFMVERDQRCAGVHCIQATSIDPSCNGDLVCGNFGRCRLVPPHIF
ncbi:MAG TPA: hypothetical protein VHW23_48520 [Kofleriaceae bacterium]|jgi:hypothetical protein|nr:hypothetical protein [Kofleriaceae bacterium]